MICIIILLIAVANATAETVAIVVVITNAMAETVVGVVAIVVAVATLLYVIFPVLRVLEGHVVRRV